MNESPNTVFKSYPVFRFIAWITSFLKWSLDKRALLLTGIFIALTILASSIDHTFTMIGTDLGLIQHPAIWMFFIIQAVIPFSICIALTRFLCFLKGNEIIQPETDLSIYTDFFQKFINRKTNLSQLVFVLATTIGLISFVWNSFQNQQPYKFLGFDFWDSINHLFGYCITRLYKFFLWVLFFPAIVHIHVAMIITLKKLLNDAVEKGFLTLRPYHQDETGGVSEIIKAAINPFIPVLLVVAFTVLSVIIVHHKVEATPIIGLCMLNFLFVMVYIIPATSLNKIIKIQKKSQVKEITETQNSIFNTLIRHEETDRLFRNVDSLNGMLPVIKQIKSIPDWPYFNRVSKLIGLINFPVIIGLINKAWPILEDHIK